MKQHLLSLFALVSAMFVSTSVVAWDEPTEPAKPTEAGEFAVGKSFFIRNVGAGQYITGSNSWSTQVSLTKNGLEDAEGESPALVILVEDLTLTYSEVEVSGYGLKLNGTYTVTGESGNREFTNTYLFRASEDASFIDWASQTMGRVWNVTKVGDYYRIQTAANDPNYPNAATEYAGWSDPDGLTIEDGGSTRVAFNLTEDDANIDWEFIPADAYLNQKNAFTARQELYEVLIEADEKGVDTSAAGKVYTNPDATVDQLKAASADLKAKIASSNYNFTGASEDEPLDVTDQVIENPNFDSNIDGWTYEGMRWQFQHRDGNGDGQVDPSKNWVHILDFAETWVASPNTQPDGKFYQTAFGLPAGTYRLEVDAMAVYQNSTDPDPENAVTGVYIFVAGPDGDLIEPLPFKAPNYQPKHWTLTFVSKGEPSISYGIRTESCTANWISCDNFQLFYLGVTDKTLEQLELEATISKAEEIDLDLTQCNKAVKDTFTEALTNAKAVVKTTDAEALTSANTALKEAYSALEKSISEYKTANDFITKLGNTEEDVANQWPDLANDFYEWGEELEGKYIAGTLTSEEIEGLEDKLATMVRDFIATPGAVKEGDDLTLLIVNADYEILGPNNKTVPGWTVVSGSITDHSTAYHNIEGYHTTFDIQQTIKNMPAGAYDVTVQGFVANEGTQNCELYAGTTVTSFKEIHEEYSTYAILANGTDEETGLGTSTGAWPYDRVFTNDEGETLYTPNSMEGAKAYFAEINPATGEPFYTNHAIIILPEAGDLTIGVRTTGGSEWILWDNFKMTYRGNKAEDYYDEIDRLLNELALAGEADDAFITAQAQTYLTELPAKATTVKNNAVADECIALITEISEAIKYIAEGNAKGEELGEIWEDYDIRKDNISSSDTTFPALLESVNAALNDPTSVANNEAIDALIKGIKDGWTGYVLADANDASLENPFDCTDIIYNTNYVHPVDGTASAAGWTYEPNPGLANDEAEFFNTNFNIYQTINGLRAGYYAFSVEGFYRAGGFAAAAEAKNEGTEALNAYMYAVVEGDTVSVFPLHSIFDGAQESPIANNEVTVTLKTESGEDIERYIPNNMEDANVYLTYTDDEDCHFYTNVVAVQVAEGGSVTIGIRKDINIDANWTIFTDWKAYYVGTEEPDGVNSINTKSRNARMDIFSIDGRQQSTLRRGINIVRMSDGSVQKVLVK